MRSLGLITAAVAAAQNMNPHPYHIANPPEGRTSVVSHRGEYFELLGPESSTEYSRVQWHSQPVPLPSDIVRRFVRLGVDPTDAGCGVLLLLTVPVEPRHRRPAR